MACPTKRPGRRLPGPGLAAEHDPGRHRRRLRAARNRAVAVQRQVDLAGVEIGQAGVADAVGFETAVLTPACKFSRLAIKTPLFSLSDEITRL